MRGSLGVLAGALVVGGLVAWLALRPGGPPAVVADLVDQLSEAREARPTRDVFAVTDASLGGLAKRSIRVTGSSRLVFAVPVPYRAKLLVSLAVAEESWAVPGEGVLFRILLSAPDERSQRVMLSQTLAPFGAPADRGWRDIELDLSGYAGRTVHLFFNTNVPPAAADGPRGDLALWGTPRIVAPEL